MWARAAQETVMAEEVESHPHHMEHWGTMVDVHIMGFCAATEQYVWTWAISRGSGLKIIHGEETWILKVTRAKPQILKETKRSSPNYLWIELNCRIIFDYFKDTVSPNIFNYMWLKAILEIKCICENHIHWLKYQMFTKGQHVVAIFLLTFKIILEIQDSQFWLIKWSSSQQQLWFL